MFFMFFFIFKSEFFFFMSNSINVYEFIEFFKLNIAVHKLIIVYCFLRNRFVRRPCSGMAALNPLKKPKTQKDSKNGKSVF